MIGSIESIDIRIGNEADREAIIEFALALSEDPYTSRDRWSKILEDKNSYPLLAVFNQNIVGNIHALIVDDIGWLEKTRVSPDFRRMGIANTLVDAAMDWIISKGISKIRTIVDSDNLSARRIIERHHFSPKILAINPSARVKNGDNEPQNTADFGVVLDEESFSDYLSMIKSNFSGNIMVDGRYVNFVPELFRRLISDRRIYATKDNEVILILSNHNLPSELNGFVITSTPEGYTRAGKAIRGFASREMASIMVCHAPATRDAMIGLAKADFGWSQPYSLIIYERDSWQERT